MTTTNKAITGALAGAAMLAMTGAAQARCEIEITDIAPNGNITAITDVYVNGRLSSQWSGNHTYHRDLSANERRAIPQLEEYFQGRGDNGAHVANRYDGRAAATGSVSQVTQRVVDNICERAFNGIRWPGVRIPEPPTREVTPPVRHVTPPVRHYAPETSPRPVPRPETICDAAEVQPIVIIEIPCDCNGTRAKAEELGNLIRQYLPDVDVAIMEETVRGTAPEGQQFRVSIQDTLAENGVEFDLVDANSDRFRITDDGSVVSIEDGANYQPVTEYIAEELRAVGYELPSAAPATPAANAAVAAPASAPAP